jgi:hypothetical protein
MDTAVANALNEKKELEKRLAEIEQFLRLYEQFSRTDGENLESSRESFDSGTALRHPLRGTFTRIPLGERRGPRVVVEAAKAAMHDLLMPLSRGDLARELGKRGVELPGATREDQARYVGTIMWRNSDIFENIEGRGYWLKGVPLPKASSELDLKGNG